MDGQDTEDNFSYELLNPTVIFRYSIILCILFIHVNWGKLSLL